MTQQSFDSAVCLLPQNLQGFLYCLPKEVKQTAQEIRLRVNKPLQLTVDGLPFWVDKTGAYRARPSVPYIITKEQIDAAFMVLCENSVYSHEEEIKQGFIALQYGHRAGVCGTYTKSGVVKDVSSINIRIARQIIGCADKAIREFDNKGILIAGPPASGKTTLLRDMVRQLSLEYSLRIAVIDTRFEIAASVGGVAINDLGDTVDVLSGYEKAYGIEVAVRTLNPQVVVFDEFGNQSETEAVALALNCGVAVIATVHAGNKAELLCNKKVEALRKTGAFSKVIMLPQKIGEEFEVLVDEAFV